MADDLAGRHICATSRTLAPAGMPGLQETAVLRPVRPLACGCGAGHCAGGCSAWHCAGAAAGRGRAGGTTQAAEPGTTDHRRADDRRGQGRARGRRRLAEGPAVHRDHARGPVQHQGLAARRRQLQVPPVRPGRTAQDAGRQDAAGRESRGLPALAGRRTASSRSCSRRRSRRACRPPAASRRASSTCSTEKSSTSPTTAACSTG